MILLKCIISAHILGLLVFNLMGLLGSYVWQSAYFWWDKTVGAGVLVWYLIYKNINANNKWLVTPVLLLSLVRFIWQVIVFFTGWDINHEWWLALFFVIVSGIAGYLILFKESKAAIFLNKNVP